jgi:hypothetical protein
MPSSWGFLAFPAVAATPSHIGIVSDILALFCNGSGALAMAGRDEDATWRTFGTLCSERDWSKQRLLYELQNGLPYRTVPPGHTIDWHKPDVVCGLETSEVTYTRGVLNVPGVLGLDRPTVGIEVLPPATPTASVRWATDTTRRLQHEGKIRKGTTKVSELARLLEAEAETAVQAGQLKHALKASYLENHLKAWGIFPLK